MSNSTPQNNAVELQIAADGPQKVFEAFDEILQDEEVQAQMQARGVATSDIKLQVNRTTPAEGALLLALIQFGSVVATEVFKQVILPRLKQRFGVKETTSKQDDKTT